MSTKRTLLPPSTTPVEQKLAQVTADLEDLPLPIRSLRRSASCPDAVLPWLAWERSVDRWDSAWPIAAQRTAVANAFMIHQHKGTISALRRAVAPIAELLDVTEWYDMVPEGPRGTFRLTVRLPDEGISEAMYQELGRLIESSKRLSQHLTGLAVAAEVHARQHYGVAAYDGDVMTVYPYQPQPVEVRVGSRSGLLELTTDTLTVYP